MNATGAFDESGLLPEGWPSGWNGGSQDGPKRSPGILFVVLVFFIDVSDGPFGLRLGGAAHGPPEDTMEKVLWRAIDLAEVHSGGSVCVTSQRWVHDGLGFRIHFIQGHLVGVGSEGRHAGGSWKQSNIGVAEASNWFMGRMPRSCSMVHSRLVVLYWVLTTAPRLA